MLSAMPANAFAGAKTWRRRPPEAASTMAERFRHDGPPRPQHECLSCSHHASSAAGFTAAHAERPSINQKKPIIEMISSCEDIIAIDIRDRLVKSIFGAAGNSSLCAIARVNILGSTLIAGVVIAVQRRRPQKHEQVLRYAGISFAASLPGAGAGMLGYRRAKPSAAALGTDGFTSSSATTGDFIKASRHYR